MDLHIDRSLPLSLCEQIKGQLVYAIMCGRLHPGQELPSVRQLSQTLGVSSATISQVYRQMAHERLIGGRPGRGTYVEETSRVRSEGAALSVEHNLHSILDSCVRQGLALGYSCDQLKDEFLAHLDRHRPAHSDLEVAIVGNFAAATESYARQVESILSDLRVRALPVLLSELEANAAQVLPRLNSAAMAITMPSRFTQVRRLLEPFGFPVAAIAFQVSLETRQRLGAIPPSYRVGVVATYPEFLSSLLSEISSYCLVQAPLLTAVLGQSERIAQMVTQIDLLVYASGSDRVRESLPDGVESIEYTYVPEADSVNRLRPLLQASAASSEPSG